MTPEHLIGKFIRPKNQDSLVMRVLECEHSHFGKWVLTVEYQATGTREAKNLYDVVRKETILVDYVNLLDQFLVMAQPIESILSFSEGTFIPIHMVAQYLADQEDENEE